MRSRVKRPTAEWIYKTSERLFFGALACALINAFFTGPLWAAATIKSGAIWASCIYLATETARLSGENVRQWKRTKKVHHFFFGWMSVACLVGMFFFVLLGAAIPIARDLGTPAQDRYQVAEGRVVSIQRRFALLTLEGDEQPFLMIFGPFKTVGSSARITYLRNSRMVLRAEPRS